MQKLLTKRVQKYCSSSFFDHWLSVEMWMRSKWDKSPSVRLKFQKIIFKIPRIWKRTKNPWQEIGPWPQLPYWDPWRESTLWPPKLSSDFVSSELLGFYVTCTLLSDIPSKTMGMTHFTTSLQIAQRFKPADKWQEVRVLLATLRFVVVVSFLFFPCLFAFRPLFFLHQFCIVFQWTSLADSQDKKPTALSKTTEQVIKTIRIHRWGTKINPLQYSITYPVCIDHHPLDYLFLIILKNNNRTH